MTSFPKRFGFEKPREVLQLTSMDDALRMGVWNWLYIQFLNDLSNFGARWKSHKPHGSIVMTVWRRVLKRSLDDLPEYGVGVVSQLKKVVQVESIGKVYWLLECFLDSKQIQQVTYRDRLIASLNYELELEQSAYRYVGDAFVAITSPEELDALAAALKYEGKFRAISDHLAQAAAHLSDRENPDFRNSIKESISAVEAACRIIVERPSATLGAALRELEKRGLRIHSSLQVGLDKLYGYSCDEKGIRHSLVEDDKLTSTEARFMLVACSAFANFLIDKSRTLAPPASPKA